MKIYKKQTTEKLKLMNLFLLNIIQFLVMLLDYLPQMGGLPNYIEIESHQTS